MNTNTALNTNSMVKIAVFTALICAVAPFTVPIGPVPISLCTFMIYITAGVLGKNRAALAVTVYVALGAFGLPVFSGFAGGAARLLGPTGGYILGYIPLAFLSAAFCSRDTVKPVFYTLGMVLGTFVLYAFGTAWFMLQSGNSLATSLTLCVLPFIPGDAAKIAVSTVCAPIIRRRVGSLAA